MRRNLVGFLLMGMIAGLSGCFDDPAPAPVVNAWYQPRASASDYIVHDGDTIYSVAWAFGLDYRALVEANHLSPPYRLSAGQHLVMTAIPESEVQKPVKRMQRPILPESNEKVRVKYGHAIAPESQSQLHYQLASHRWQWPTQGHVFQGFSTNPSGHPGISIAGRFDSPVRAAASGVIVYSGDGVRGYGNLIIIKHNNSYLSAYGFNERNLVFVGDRVHAGQVIARMGKNDGGRTLLYFEIRRDGIPIDPMRFLR